MGMQYASKTPKIVSQQGKTNQFQKKKSVKNDPVSRYQTLQNDRKR